YEQVVFSPDGRYVASLGRDLGTAIVWDARTHEQVATLRQVGGHPIAFSPDSRRLLTGTDDGYTILWDFERQTKISAIHVADEAIWSVAFTPDGRSIVTGTVSGVVQLWDLATRKELRRFAGHHDVAFVALSPDGRHLLTASGDQTARLWDVATGAEL